jgi:hypothetical protein
MGKVSKEKMRNLVQYRDMSEEEFDELWEKRIANAQPSADFEKRIQKKIEEFSQDYDIDDLKINDKESLRALVQAVIALEDYEQILFRLRSTTDFGNFDIVSIDKISKVMSDLRSDISKIQGDLNITRKVRKSDKEASVITYLEDLKEKAKQFYESRAMYVYCDKCNMLLATLWTLYPKEDNKLVLHCNRVLDDGSKCDNKVTVSTKDLIEKRGTNKPEIVPESLL